MTTERVRLLLGGGRAESRCLPVSRWGALCAMAVGLMLPGAAIAQPDPCMVATNGTGTVTLPPAGCEYLTADQVHMIIDGLPPGTAIELDTIHVDFICKQPGTPQEFCNFPGGNLGGEVETFNSTLSLTMTGTNGLSFSRQIDLQNVFCEVHTGPRNPGDPVQSFANEMVMLQGSLPAGDPDFQTLTIVAGTNFGLPSPGQTTLTQMVPGGDWHVDSFFDITYQIDFVGAPGGALGGMAGSTAGTVRVTAQAAPCACNGDVNGDGSMNVIDLAQLLSCVNLPPTTPGCAGADINCDAVINQADVDAFNCLLGGGTPDVCCAQQDCVPPGQDCWSTTCGNGTQTDFSANPIPADFFDPGSQPFGGIIELGGATMGGIDTIIQRLDQMCFPLPLPSSANVPIEIVALDLVGCQPITVGGSGDWNVAVSLSTNGPGTLTATKNDATGGTFTADFSVQPIYTFTRTVFPFDTRVFDPANETPPIPPIQLSTVANAPWSTDETFDPCTPDGFHGGGSQDPTGQPCCEEVCHGVSGDPNPCDPTQGHCHCTTPPDCPICPPLQPCCLPDGSCADVADCALAGGTPVAACQGDADGDGLDDACFRPPCADCGPGPHFIDQPAPGCLGGLDQMPTGALVGIDTNLDCIVDANLVLHGPVTVARTDPMDDSVNFPGSAPVNGHLETIDTEIIAMSLSGGGVTMTAGAGLGALPLSATLGNIVEQPADPSLADSRFDVFFEVDLGAGVRGYNTTALRLDSEIICIPPDARYFHITGCTPLFDTPAGGFQIGNLVSADHDTYPTPEACCFTDGTCQDLPPQDCELAGGQPKGAGSACQGDVNPPNGIDDACEDPLLQACCLPGGGCIDALAQDCAAQGGIPQGSGTNCFADGELCQEDCNENGNPDVFDVATGNSADANNNGIPDECEAPCCDPASHRNGDWDGDCDLDLVDWSTMQICLGRHTGAAAGCVSDGCMAMDLNADGQLTLADHAVFAAAMGGPNQPLPGCDPTAGSCDAWGTGPRTDPGLEFGGTFYVFGNPPQPVPTGYTGQNPPIPAGFFGSGSLPFDGVVALAGQPENLKTMGSTDTLVEHPPLRFGFGPLPQQDIVPARLSSLHLRSVDPIKVDVNTNGTDCNGNGIADATDIAGGTSADQNTNGIPDECEWYVAAELSTVSPPDGTITANRTHANGGTFDADINVQPLFVFVRKDALDAGMVPSSANVKVLDTGEQGLPPIVFQFTNVPFSICAPAGEGIYVAPCSQGNFIPGLDTSGARQRTTCQSHIQPGESHYFCPPRCIESLCTYPAAAAAPLGFCFPFGCGFPSCPPFPPNLQPGPFCTALNPATCPQVGYFVLALGPCPVPPCFPLGLCIQFYGPPITCTPTGRFLCP